MYSQIGSTFALLFAGHGQSGLSCREHGVDSGASETTGHTLAATLGFLAAHEDEQEIAYKQVLEVVGNDRDPVSVKFNCAIGIY